MANIVFVTYIHGVGKEPFLDFIWQQSYQAVCQFTQPVSHATKPNIQFVEIFPAEVTTYRQ